MIGLLTSPIVAKIYAQDYNGYNNYEEDSSYNGYNNYEEDSSYNGYNNYEEDSS